MVSRSAKFLKASASPPVVLQPGSCHAARIEASLLAGAAPGPALSPEVEAEKQAAYARKRAAWRAFVGAPAQAEKPETVLRP